MTGKAADARNVPRLWPLLLGVALILCAARASWVLGGMPEAPVYDAWSAIDGIAVPAAGGAFDWRYLFAPHNEHLLVWTKLLDWLQLRAADDQYDARPVGLLLALWSGILAALLLVATARRLAIGRGAFLCAGVALFGLPYAWENLTEDWGNPYLLPIAGAVATLWLALHATRLRTALLLLAASVFSALAMGSGWVAPAIGVALVALRAGIGDLRRTTAVALAMVQAAAIALAASLLLGRTHAGPKAALDPLLAAAQLGLAAVAFAPAVLFAAAVWHERPRADAPLPSRQVWRSDASIVALALWSALQLTAMILLRPQFRIWFPFSRYMDIMAFALLANLACGLLLVQSLRAARWHRLATSAARIVAATAILAAPLPLALYAWQVERWHGAEALLQQAVRDHDPHALDRASDTILPMPDRAYLRARLADPRVQRILGDRVGTRTTPAVAIAASRRLETWLGAHAALLLLAALSGSTVLIAIAYRARAPAAIRAVPAVAREPT